MANLFFDKAKSEDFGGILDIEEEYFSSYGRALDKESMTKWFNHNHDMFYVVKNEVGEVLATTILVPVVEELYEKLKSGQVSDLFDFKEEEVPKNSNSNYFHLESVCATKKKGVLNFYKAANIMLRNMIDVVYMKTDAKYVTTSPITEEGKKIVESVGFVFSSYETYEGEKYPIYVLPVTKEKYNELSSRHKNRIN